MLVVTPDGRLIEANAEAARVLSIPSSQRTSLSLGQLLETEVDVLSSFLARCLKSECFAKGEFFLIAGSDGERKLLVEGAHLEGADPDAILLRISPGTGDSPDDSDDHSTPELESELRLRQSAEKRLRNSEQRYRTLFNGAGDAIFVYPLLDDGRVGTLLEVNDAAVAALGYSREQLLSMRPSDIIDSDTLDLSATLDLLRTRGHVVLESCHITREDTRIPVEVSAHLFEMEGKPTVLSICRDISERKRVESERADLLYREQRARQQAEESREQMAFLVEASAVLARDLDYEQTLRDLANLLVPRLADWCTVTVTEDDGALRQVAVAHSDSARVQRALDLNLNYRPHLEDPYGVGHVITTGEPQLYEEIDDELLRSAISDDAYRDVVLSLGLRSALIVPMTLRDWTFGAITFVYSESGRRYGRGDLPFAQELAARAAREVENARLFRQAQIARDQAQEMSRLKTAFLANMSHEIRTPLTSIIGFASLLQSQLPAEKRPLAQHITAGGKRLLETLDAVLSLSQLESRSKGFALTPVDIADAARQAAALFQDQAQRRGLDLRLELPADGAPVMALADSGAVASILQNLVGNALKFTSEGHVTVRVVDVDAHVELMVEDSGIGIDLHFHRNLFEPFYQESSGWSRDYEGSGLGLAITKRLAEEVGASIDVKSEKGRGTRFTVRFTRSESVPMKATEIESSPHEEVIEKSPRILLVEDNADTGIFMEVLLSDAGEVTLATTADEALAAIEAEDTAFDLVILDINLGRGKSGTDVLHVLRQNPGFADVRVAAVTAYAMPGDRARLMEEGFDAYLSKPFAPDELMTLVQSLLG